MIACCISFVNMLYSLEYFDNRIVFQRFQAKCVRLGKSTSVLKKCHQHETYHSWETSVSAQTPGSVCTGCVYFFSHRAGLSGHRTGATGAFMLGLWTGCLS